MTSVLHQLGFREVWNFQSFDDDSVGEGFILSPIGMPRNKVEELPQERRSISLFDPQFFLPAEKTKQLSTYDFFPEALSNGFQTSQFSGEDALACAEQCMQFQLDCGFRGVTIPCRYLDLGFEDYTRQQESLFIHPFLQKADELEIDKPLHLQIIVTERMAEEEYRNELLNWITNFESIENIYLIPYSKSRSKHITNQEYLIGLLHMISDLEASDIQVMVGYLNVESVFLSVVKPSFVTVGIYENRRMFRPETFSESGDGGRSPNPRIYSPTLLQWVDARYRAALEEQEDLGTLFSDNHYRVIMQNWEDSDWHFQKSELYKHYMLEISHQIHDVSSLNQSGSFDRLAEMLDAGITKFEQLSSAGIRLTEDSNGDHLYHWATALGRYRNQRGV